MVLKCYQELIAWQKAMDLVTAVYGATAGFPQREIYGLTNQMRRAAVSIPSNIAEGQGRNTTKDFCNFLCHSRGSLQELETQTIIALRLNYLNAETHRALIDMIAETGRITHGLLAALRAKTET